MKILKTLALGAALAASAAFSHAMAAETVRFWYHFDNPANPMSDLVKKFETANPDIKIEAENVPWNRYYDNLYTSMVGGNAPDAMICSGPIFLPSFLNSKLSKYLKLPVVIPTAPTLSRVFRSLIRSKSTRRSRVRFSGAVS